MLLYSIMMDLELQMAGDHYVIFFGQSARFFSNAPYNGGYGNAEAYINRHVSIDYNSDPVIDTEDFLEKKGYDKKKSVVTLTAVDVSTVVEKESHAGNYEMLTYVTSGTGNALSIGSYGRPGGTINICVVTDLPLSDSAALGLFQTVIESKSQAMNDLGIVDRSTGRPSPGTSTDTVSLFLLSGDQRLQYGGRLTEYGRLISLMVYDSIRA